MSLQYLMDNCYDQVKNTPPFDWGAAWVDVACLTSGIAREDARSTDICLCLCSLERAYVRRDIDAFMNLKDFVLVKILKEEWRHPHELIAQYEKEEG